MVEVVDTRQMPYWAQVSPVEYKEVAVFYPETRGKISCTCDYLTRCNRDHFFTWARQLYVMMQGVTA